MKRKKYYIAVEKGEGIGGGTKKAWLKKKDATRFAKRNDMVVKSFLLPDSEIDSIDLERIKKGTTDRFYFNTTKVVLKK